MVAPPLLRQFLGVVNDDTVAMKRTYSAPSRPSLVGSGRPLGQPAPQRSPDPPTPARAEAGAGCARAQLAAAPDEIGLRPPPWMWQATPLPPSCRPATARHLARGFWGPSAAHGVCAGCAGAPLEERVALAIPAARRAGRGHTDRSSEGRKAGASGPRALRGVVSRPDLPDGRRWPEPELGWPGRWLWLCSEHGRLATVYPNPSITLSWCC